MPRELKSRPSTSPTHPGIQGNLEMFVSRWRGRRPQSGPSTWTLKVDPNEVDPLKQSWHPKQSGPSNKVGPQSGPSKWTEKQSGPSKWTLKQSGPPKWTLKQSGPANKVTLEVDPKQGGPSKWTPKQSGPSNKVD